ncbi:MAG: Fe-S cluster assembly protein SufD [Chthoniobacterales bacterium]|nr:Fe-S cluster assembly protein SufD [Chthoniobacterales bacterium]MDQ3119415.1 Fe-S cluster assembly protein SufD [Verrucomicrobiota bacterium]
MSILSAVLDEVPVLRQDKSAPTILGGIPEGEGSELPEWFIARRQEAWRQFSSLPMPARKDQAWRFSNVKALDLAPFALGQAPGDGDRREILDRSVSLDEVAGRLIYADDHLLRRDPLPEPLRALGVIMKPLERGLIEHEELFRQHFMAQPVALGSAKFAALHEAFVKSGTFIYVPRGVEVELPIEIFHWLNDQDASVFPHTLLIADELSKVTVIEHFRSTHRDRRGFACGVNDLVAGRGAKISYVCAQNWGEKVLSVQMNATTAERDASALSLNVHLGGMYSRFESLSRLIGEGARSDLLSVSVGAGTQEFDARTLQEHASPHTTSDLLYKNSLSDLSRNTFGGLIRVEPHAHFTDAYQTVRNLLLSDDAEANSMPGLEILADNVKCSHGATSGQLNEDEFFYLLARGIPARAARQLLVGGFLNEVVQRLNHPAIAEKIHELIEEKFARAAR